MFLYIRKSLCHAARYDKPFLPRKGQAIPADMDMGKTTRTCMQCRGSRRAFTTIEERNGLMPGNMIGQPYLETALPAKFLQYDIASTVARYRKYMTVLGQPLGLLYDALGHVQQADVGLGVRLAPAGDFFFVRRKFSKLLKMNSRNKLIYITIGDLYHKKAFHRQTL